MLTRRVDRVALAGALAGTLSFGLSFVVSKGSRLASGMALFTWQVLTLPQLILLASLWASALAVSFFNPNRRTSAILTGLIGNSILATVFLVAGAGARHLASPANPFQRTSLGFGAWLMVIAAYVLILASQQGLEDSKTVRLFISTSGLVVLTVAVALGYLNELSILKEYFVRRDRFMSEFFTHLILSGSSVAIAAAIGIPLGIWSFRKKVLEKPVFFFVNSVQTIPSLALFGLMIAPLSLLSQRYPVLRDLGIRGIGWAPALIALTLYALLPITRNTYTSLKILDPAISAAGIGMGMSRWQLLLSVQIPLSLTIILGGLRTSMVQAVGNTTVAALIGAGGFGVFVFQGLGQAVPDLILLGALPVIILAVLIDKLMQLLVRFATPRGLAGVRE